MPQVFAVVTDLFFSERIAGALSRLGHSHLVADLSLGPAPPIPAGTRLVLVDLEGGEPSVRAIRAARDAGLPVLAFGPHTDRGLRQTALAAGASRVVAKSKLTASFADLVTEMLQQ